MKKGDIGLPIAFVGLLALGILILIVLSWFGYNLVGNIKDLIMGALTGIADFFASLFSLGNPGV